MAGPVDPPASESRAMEGGEVADRSEIAGMPRFVERLAAAKRLPLEPAFRLQVDPKDSSLPRKREPMDVAIRANAT
jgi:hypothetical protein